MDTLTEEADACCKKAWNRLVDADQLGTANSFVCPECGVEYRPRLIIETMRHWEACCWEAKI